MAKNKRYRRLLLVAGAFVLALIVGILMWMGRQENAGKTKVGFIMSGQCSESGWNGMHYQGVKNACGTLDAELIVRESVGEYTGQCVEAVRELAKEKAEIIILSSYGYSGEVKELVRQYPEITFYCNSSEYHEENMTSYFVRMYQARYLAGILAGMQTESGKIGYVAAMANNEVNRGISAFTMGVRRMNPDAEVVVIWTGAWDAEEKETAAAKMLIEEQVDVITYHQNQPYTVYAADEAGIKSIGYHQKIEGMSENYLTSIVCDWEQVYEELITAALRGKGNAAENYWIGLEKDAVGLSEYSGIVTEEQKTTIEAVKAEILAGKEIFSGVIYDTEGNLRCGENEIISDEKLLEHFDWYVEGVRFYEN